MKILVIEDDEMVGASLIGGLRDAGYIVDWLRDGRSASTALSDSRNHFSLVLLDWALPHQDGVSLLNQLREQGSDVPVLMITARDEVEARVLALDLGADDYLVKPFALAELLARIRRALRRKEGRARNEIVYGDLVISPEKHTVMRSGNLIPLSAQEFRLLAALMERPGSVLSRDQLEQRLYGWDHEVIGNVVDVVVHHVRRKIGSDMIENVRSVGWRIRAMQ